MTETTIHRFEKAGLGKAPFRYTGMHESVYQACPGAPIQPGSSCDYCGTGIRYCFGIRSADGVTSKVGSECIHKHGDDGLKHAHKADPAVRKHQRELRHAREAKKMAALLEQFEAAKPKLAALPHSKPWAADKSRLDEFEYILSMCGTSGKLKWLVRAIKAAA